VIPINEKFTTKVVSKDWKVEEVAAIMATFFQCFSEAVAAVAAESGVLRGEKTSLIP
jgi:hypothetical protein